jgi:hypothetical protein
METGPVTEVLTPVYIKPYPNDKKGYCTCAGLHSITSHNKVTLVVTAMKTSNMTHSYTDF